MSLQSFLQKLSSVTQLFMAMSSSMPTAAVFLAEFLRSYEEELVSNLANHAHLFNFHARIYHQLLQQIDSHFQNQRQNQNTNNNQNKEKDDLYPASITISIKQLSELLPIIKKNIQLYFNYDGELEGEIDKFFKILTRKLKKITNHFNKKGNSNSRKRRHANDNNTNNAPSHKRQKLSNAEDIKFGPYKRRHSLRYDL